MLWLCLHFPQLPLSALGAEPDELIAVVEQAASQRWLITPAADCAAGSSLAQASMLYPKHQYKVRKPQAEQEALLRLAHWAYRFGQPVTAQIHDLMEVGRVPRALLWIEIGSSLKLFGGIAALRKQLCSELIEFGHIAQLSIAPTRAGAELLACSGCAQPIQDMTTLRKCIADLPLHVLHWPESVLKALSGVGFKNIGALLDVPRDAFVRRFGAAHRMALDRIIGTASEPMDAIVPPETFRRRFELAAEIENATGLQFPLKRMCSELQAYLRTRDRGLRSVSLVVSHAGARQTHIHAQFLDPHRDATRMFNALKERLDRDGLPMAARELLLLADNFTEASVPQTDLFDQRAGQAQLWAAAIERIRARLGEEKVWTPRMVEDHRPEYSTKRSGDQWSGTQSPPSAHAADSALYKPTFLLQTPWPMPAPACPELQSFERIESGWWDQNDIRRDYTTLDINGARAWAFREVGSGAWYLHGWWS